MQAVSTETGMSETGVFDAKVFQLMGRAIAERDVAAAQHGHDGGVGIFAPGVGDPLREGTIPGLLGLDEAFELRLLHRLGDGRIVGLGRSRL